MEVPGEALANLATPSGNRLKRGPEVKALSILGRGHLFNFCLRWAVVMLQVTALTVASPNLQTAVLVDATAWDGSPCGAG